MRHLIDPLDFTQQEISTLLDLADRIHDDPATPNCPFHQKMPSKRGVLFYSGKMKRLRKDRQTGGSDEEPPVSFIL